MSVSGPQPQPNQPLSTGKAQEAAESTEKVTRERARLLANLAIAYVQQANDPESGTTLSPQELASMKEVASNLLEDLNKLPTDKPIKLDENNPVHHDVMMLAALVMRDRVAIDQDIAMQAGNELDLNTQTKLKMIQDQEKHAQFVNYGDATKISSDQLAKANMQNMRVQADVNAISEREQALTQQGQVSQSKESTAVSSAQQGMDIHNTFLKTHLQLFQQLAQMLR